VWTDVLTVLTRVLFVWLCPASRRLNASERLAFFEGYMLFEG